MDCRTYYWVSVSLLILLAGCDSKPDQLPEDSAIFGGASIKALVEGAGDERRIEAFEQLKDTIAANPTETDRQLEMLGLLTSVGHSYHQKGDQQKMNAVFEAAMAAADRLELDQNAAPDDVKGLLQQVYYYGACAQAQKGDPTKAVESLGHVMEWGFDHFEMLRNEDDLEDVRSLAGFDAKMEVWVEAARKATLEKVVAEMAQAEPFPFDFELTDIKGKDVRLADFKGKVVVVDVWGTWCPPCREEIPSFMKLQDNFGPQGLQVIGVNYEQASGDAAVKLVSDFVTRKYVNYPCVMGDEKTRDQIPNFQSFPTTLFIDKTGEVRLKVTGAKAYTFLEAVVSVLMAEPEADAS